MMDHASFAETFDTSPISGFLPHEPLLTQLPSQYAEWEKVCAAIPVLTRESRLEEVVLNMPLLP